MKKEIDVTFEEALTRTVTLTVDDENELDQQVRQAYQNEQVVLDDTDLQSTQFLIETPAIYNGDTSYNDWIEI